MFSRVVHGIAVLLTLLPFVLLDRAFGQSQPGASGNEPATFAERFSAITDAPASPQQPAMQAEPQEHSSDTPAAGQPFALNLVPVTAGGVLDKWNGVVADIRAESETDALPQRRSALPGGGTKIPRRHRRRSRP
jgi:hypothetical protein